MRVYVGRLQQHEVAILLYEDLVLCHWLSLADVHCRSAA